MENNLGKKVVEPFGMTEQPYHPGTGTPIWGNKTTFENGDVEIRTYTKNTFSCEFNPKETPHYVWDKGEEEFLELNLTVDVQPITYKVFHPTDGSDLTNLITEYTRKNAFENEEFLMWNGKSWVKKRKR